MASEKRVAEQLATLAIIAKIIGHEFDPVPDNPAVAEALPPTSPAWIDSIDGEPKGHLINKLAGKQGWMVAFDCTSTGPSHKPIFQAGVTVKDGNGSLIAEATGAGPSKRDAERAAALAVIPMLPKATDAATTNGSALPNPVNGLQEFCQRNRLRLPAYEFKASGKPNTPRHRCTRCGSAGTAPSRKPPASAKPSLTRRRTPPPRYWRKS